MSAAVAAEIELPAEVCALLRQHRAEPAFAKVCDLARECFPESTALGFRLIDDPDSDDRTWLAVVVEVPSDWACTTELRRRESKFHESFVTEIPLDLCPLFTLQFVFVDNAA